MGTEYPKGPEVLDGNPEQTDKTDKYLNCLSSGISSMNFSCQEGKAASPCNRTIGSNDRKANWCTGNKNTRTGVLGIIIRR